MLAPLSSHGGEGAGDELDMWLQIEIVEEFKCFFNKLKPELKLAVVFATPPKPHFAYALWVLHLEYNLSTGGERAAHCLAARGGSASG